MNVLSRKERQYQEREALILTTARAIILEQGYYGMSMEQLAKLTEYSKGTIYQHFSCKEDILAVLYLEHAELLVHLLEFCDQQPGSCRWRMRLMQFGYGCLMESSAFDFELVHTISASPFREKASASALSRIDQCESRVLDGVLSYLEGAISDGELHLPGSMTAEEAAFGVWSLSFGAIFLKAYSCPVEKLGIDKAAESASRCIDVYLDGLGWQPLSKDFDYPKELEGYSKQVLAALHIE